MIRATKSCGNVSAKFHRSADESLTQCRNACVSQHHYKSIRVHLHHCSRLQGAGTLCSILTSFSLETGQMNRTRWVFHVCSAVLHGENWMKNRACRRNPAEILFVHFLPRMILIVVSSSTNLLKRLSTILPAHFIAPRTPSSGPNILLCKSRTYCTLLPKAHTFSSSHASPLSH